MSKLYLYICILAIFLAPFPKQIFSQQNHNDHFFGIRPGNISLDGWTSGSKDFIELSYGLGELKHKNLQTKFNSPILVEIKLGRRILKPIQRYKLIQVTDNYLFTSYIKDNIQSVNNTSKISSEIWRFGVGHRKGYGYDFGSFAILPYYQMGLVMNKINLNLPNQDNYIIPPDDIPILNNFENKLKFGTTNIGGVDFRVSSLLGIGVSYETAIIFPYYKVWKQFGSFIIETFSQTGIDFLMKGVIIKSMPEVAPVLYFILKNGLSYFFFTLKQENMNWPFDTVPPLTFEALKFNLNISF